MGRNYRFLIYGSRSHLPGLLQTLAQWAEPPHAKAIDIHFENTQLTFQSDANADKNPDTLALTQPEDNLKLLTWLQFEFQQLPDAAEDFIRNHWAEDNQQHVSQGRFRFGVEIEITVSEHAYELALSSPTSSGSAIFSFSPNVRNRFLSLLEQHQAWFGLFDSEQDTYKVLPLSVDDIETTWDHIQLSFEEEDLILYSDRSGQLDLCVKMLAGKIQGLKNAGMYLSKDFSV